MTIKLFAKLMLVMMTLTMVFTLCLSFSADYSQQANILMGGGLTMFIVEAVVLGVGSLFMSISQEGL